MEDCVFRGGEIVSLLCKSLPHSMHERYKLKNFLRLRTVSRTMVVAVTAQMGHRIAQLLRHRYAPVQEVSRKMKDSGILYQMLFCGGNPRSQGFLSMDENTGIPKGMSQRYWDERQRRNLITGWNREGKLEL